MITPVSPSTRNCYKRFESAREENQRAMRGSLAVQASPQGQRLREARPGPQSGPARARPEQRLKRAITCDSTERSLDLADLALRPKFLWFFAISLALLKGNLVLLFSAGGNAVRERKGWQEKKNTRARWMEVARGVASETD